MKKQNTKGVHLWLLLWKAYKAVETYSHKSIDELDFACLSDFALLEVLYHKGPMPVNSIGDKLSLTSGSITTAVDRASDKGLVKRERDEEDKRIVNVYLTKKGENKIKEGFGRHECDMENVFSLFTAEERETFAALLKKAGQSAAAMNL